MSRELSWLRWVSTGRFSLSWATGGGATRGGWRRRCVVRQQTDSNVARRWFACHLCSIEVSTNLGETSGMAGRRGAMSFRALFCGVGLAGGWCLGVEGVSRVFRRGWGRDSGTPCCCVRLAALVFLGCVAPCCPVRIGRSGSKSPLILPAADAVARSSATR